MPLACIPVYSFNGWAVHRVVSDQPIDVNTPATRQAQQESSRIGCFVSLLMRTQIGGLTNRSRGSQTETKQTRQTRTGDMGGDSWI